MSTAQDDNVGDVVLRREYLDRLRAVGSLHIYVGGLSPDFVRALALDPTDVVYRQFRRWRRAGWHALARGAAWYVEKPGELALDRASLRRQLEVLPFVIGVRLRRGQVLRVGMGLRTTATDGRLLRLLFRLSTLVRWRDTTSPVLFGFGEASPDWAFGWEGTPDEVLDRDRRGVLVTFRGDRAAPTDDVVDAIRAVAAADSRPVIVAAQVRRDAERAALLAHRLGAELVPWPAERTLVAHEAVLRELYRDSAIVISDRLHGLIMGMTEGAVPLCLTERGEAKVERHLDAVGFRGSAFAVHGRSAASIQYLIQAQLERRAEAVDAVRVARGELHQLAAHIAARSPKDGTRGPRR